MTNCLSFMGTNFMSTNGMGWMMWGAGLFWLLVAVLLFLAVAALIKYLRSDSNDTSSRAVINRGEVS